MFYCCCLRMNLLYLQREQVLHLMPSQMSTSAILDTKVWQHPYTQKCSTNKNVTYVTLVTPSDIAALAIHMRYTDQVLTKSSSMDQTTLHHHVSTVGL